MSYQSEEQLTDEHLTDKPTCHMNKRIARNTFKAIFYKTMTASETYFALLFFKATFIPGTAHLSSSSHVILYSFIHLSLFSCFSSFTLMTVFACDLIMINMENMKIHLYHVKWETRYTVALFSSYLVWE